MYISIHPRDLLSVVAVGALFFLFVSPAARSADSDIETLRQRVLRRLHDHSVDEDAVRQLMTDMNPDGSWSDVDYGDRSRTDWDPIHHLRRLRKMARAATVPGSDLKGHRTLLDRIEKGLRLWFDRKPDAKNWWWNDIGVPMTLGPLLVMTRDHLPEKILQQGVRRMPNQLRKHAGTDMDEILNDEFLIHRGLVANNKKLIRKAFGHMLSDLEVKTGIGIKADFSFHNHGPQLYNGGYGLPTVNAWAKWAYLTRETAFSFPREKRRLVAQSLLEGYRWMSWYELIDYGAHGRNISRKGIQDGARSLLSSLEKLAELVPSKRTQLQAYAAHIRGDPPGISGNRNFWLSDFMVHRRNDYYTSVSMTSKDVVGTEIGNGEAIQSYYLPFGSNFIFHGPPGAYKDLFTVWNWTRVPGVTAPHAQKPPMPVGRSMGWQKVRGQTDFVGGVSNGTYGVSAFDYALDDTSARKSWFFFDREYVALGAGIQSGSDDPIVTTVNQSLRRGDLLFAGGTSALNALSHGNERTLTSPVRVHHDGIGYVFPRSGDRVHVGSRTQTGSWNRINLKYSKEKVSKRVFNLWQEHGKQPDGDSYRYIVAPGSQSEQTKTYLTDQSPIRVRSNTPSLQAVRHRKLDLTMMAFYEAGRCSIDDQRALSVDTPCLVMVRRAGNGFAVSVANPNGDAATVRVRIHSKQNEHVVSKHTFELPGGQQGGRTVTHSMKME